MRGFLALVSVVVFSIGCAKSDYNKAPSPKSEPTPEQSIQALDLSNKSTSEILDLKYNRAQLKCSLWSQNNKQIDLKLPANITTTLNLKSPPALPKDLVLKANVNNHQIQVILKVTKLGHMGNYKYTDSSGNNVEAKFSPYIEVESSYISQTNISKGYSSTRSGSSLETVREKDHIIILYSYSAQLIEPQPKRKKGQLVTDFFSDYVSCTLETDIKQMYQDQFLVQKSN